MRKAEIADLIVRLRSDEAWTTCLKPEALPLLEGWHSTPGILPLSSILGMATLGDPVRAFDIVGEFGAQLNDSDRNQHCNWAWPLTNINSIPMQPAKGMQGFWDWNPF